MPWSSLTCFLLALIYTTATIKALDWNFFNHDDDSTLTLNPNYSDEILSPETLNEMMGSDYLDRVKEMIYSGKNKIPDSSSDISLSSTSKVPAPPASPAHLTSSFVKTRPSIPSRTDLVLPSMDDIATPLTAVNAVQSTYRNWVGPWSQSADPACYREAHIMKTCPSNYDRNNLTSTCWTECPIDYPVECGMQCVQQNNGCMRENAAKVSAVAMSALSSATFGVFGEFAKFGKRVGWGIICADYLLIFVRAVIRFTRNQLVNEPETTEEKLLLLLYQTNWVVVDLPATILVCSGKVPHKNLQLTRLLLPTAQYLLLLAMTNKDNIIENWAMLKAFMIHANFSAAAEQLTEGETSSLEAGMKQNSTCGEDLKTLTTHVWSTVSAYRHQNPKIKEGDLRFKVSESTLVRYDIPTVTNNCISQFISESSVATRDILRKTYGVMINDLVKTGTSDNRVHMMAKHTAYTWIRYALFFASLGWDPTDLATLFSEFLQTVCGPTQFMGEIDDGNEYATLGMSAHHQAFKNSSLTWTKEGDGAVVLNFKNHDTKAVAVNIKSGGDKIDEVELKAGGSAQWRSSISVLGGKTLYLDRWRPGIFGLPTTGGGSLVLWVPISRQGGHLDLDVQINRT
ncbi:hypothetical protein CCR75_007023 [Bremia lactucae]|uniref:Uncharacterized protein n=1 Tax=Bremia lactucae TaxID=4779 RepID=A0A976FNS1_BRELC|nr:hypothetical protein CCR75_007023 [Bremia lactucae]